MLSSSNGEPAPAVDTHLLIVAIEFVTEKNLNKNLRFRKLRQREGNLLVDGMKWWTQMDKVVVLSPEWITQIVTHTYGNKLDKLYIVPNSG